jgi:hypothetical protein
MRVQIQNQKIRTVGQQSVIKAIGFETPGAILFLCEIDMSKCVMDDESYFTVKGDEYGNSKVIISLKIKIIHKIKFPAKVLLWLDVSKGGVSEPIFF